MIEKWMMDNFHVKPVSLVYIDSILLQICFHLYPDLRLPCLLLSLWLHHGVCYTNSKLMCLILFLQLCSHMTWYSVKYEILRIDWFLSCRFFVIAMSDSCCSFLLLFLCFSLLGWEARERFSNKLCQDKHVLEAHSWWQWLLR